MYVFSSLGSILRCRIAGLYTYSMFNLLRNYQIISQTSWTILYSYQLCMIVPISPQPCCICYPRLITCLFYFSHPSGCDVLIRIYLITNDIDIVSCVYRPFPYSFWRNSYSDALPIFKNWVIILLLSFAFWLGVFKNGFWISFLFFFR